MGDLNQMADMEDVGKIEPLQEGSSESVETTPELDVEGYQQEIPQPQKRKGGRKPIYATSEERKQRNRQAQAAFRERRTEYIKQLEHTIKQQEASLQTLQQNHRSAADECLMLRYKNSLLERILLEKGIDVQAELRTKTGSPNLGPTHMPPAAPGPPQPPVQRALLNRQNHARRPITGLAPKLERPQIHPHAEVGGISNSPQQPTPSSHASSPSGGSIRSPITLPSGGVHSPTSIHVAQQQGQHQQSYQPLQPAIPTTNYTSPAVSTSSASTALGITNGPGLYPSQFQTHYDQLEQEYDAQAEMIDDDDTSPSEGPRSAGAGANQFAQHSSLLGHSQNQLNPSHVLPQTSIIPPGQPPPQIHPTTRSQGDTSHTFGAMDQLFHHYDPLIDSDPFGLSASMHFPTEYQYQQQQQQGGQQGQPSQQQRPR